MSNENASEENIGSPPEKKENDNELKKEFSAQQMAMMAISGALGIGLLIGCGNSLAAAGPLPLVICFTAVGALVYLIMCSVCEIATFIPSKEGFTGYASRYVDPCLGFAVGWAYFINYICVTPHQITSSAMLFQYWVDRETLNPGVFIAIIFAIGFAINLCLTVRMFSIFQYYQASLKLVVLLALVIALFVISLGGGPDHKRVGFGYYNNPGAIKEYGKSLPNGDYYQAEGDLGRFISFASVLITAVFSYLGVELVGITVAEAKNPRKTIPTAVRLTAIRSIGFYIICMIVLGMALPYNDPELLRAVAGESGVGVSSSPFIIILQNSGIRVLPHIVNGLFMFFILGSSVAGFYIGSRTLYGLAQSGKAPAIFMKTNKHGNPVNSLIAVAVLSCTAFLNASASSAVVFNHFMNFSAILGLLTWITILITHIQFRKALEKQNKMNQLTWKAPWQPYASYVCIGVCIVLAIIKNFTVFLGGSIDWPNVITGYVAIPVFIVLNIGYKLYTGHARIDPEKADLVAGRSELDDEQKAFEAAEAEKEPVPKWKKVLHGAKSILF
ncbi:dicarboxylic amino acid permease [Trichomonascus vanleenenianus]|uniref:dicarboxylic amino acid permease n=1 Tax=Trichomonascus vanleenenianus TaxID=2268995 RepID=UPI003ECA2C45